MKSDMSGRGLYTAKEVGRNLYVWSMGDRGPSRRKCVISAHGCAALITNEAERRKLPRDVKVVFYGPHGSMLQNPGLYNVATGLQPSHETFTTNGMGQDYELSKSQDAHQGTSGKNESSRGTGEGYRFIGEEMHDMKAYHDRVITAGPAFRAQVAAQFGNYERKIVMDVVTVRSRKLFADITLFRVINELWANGYKYEEIHCAFCRGVGDKPPSWNPTQNKGSW